MGFTTYITPAPVPEPTLLEKIALLSGAQKSAILAGYESDKKIHDLKHETGVPAVLLSAIYKEIDEIRALTKMIVREEIVITEGAYDEEGNEITAPVYNDAPSTIPELEAEVAANFTDVFTADQVAAVIGRMIAWSEVDASGAPIGTVAVWAAEVVK